MSRLQSLLRAFFRIVAALLGGALGSSIGFHVGALLARGPRARINSNSADLPSMIDAWLDIIGIESFATFIGLCVGVAAGFGLAIWLIRRFDRSALR
jgi:hypothetical protein